jgi:predicted DNA-binding transcriptional regulator YafY
MNKTDRLLAIVLELQAKERQRAEDLAATFEVSKRTIYRDIEALCEAGVPILSIPGLGYSLMQGYFLPPLSFTSDEATMLLLGCEFMSLNFDAQYRQAAQAAARKINGVLPVALRAEVSYLQNSIRFITPDMASRNITSAMLQQLRRAIIQQNTVRFTYHKRDTSKDMQVELTTREADPYALIHIADRWYLTAYCHLRHDTRVFFLDRMENLEVLATTFQRPANYVVKEPERDTRTYHARVLFDKEVARWVLESRFYYIVATDERPEGLLVTLQARQESDILPWLLSWGRHAVILEPEILRQHLLAEIDAISKRYTPIDDTAGNMLE